MTEIAAGEEAEAAMVLHHRGAQLPPPHRALAVAEADMALLRRARRSVATVHPERQRRLLPQRRAPLAKSSRSPVRTRSSSRRPLSSSAST